MTDPIQTIETAIDEAVKEIEQHTDEVEAKETTGLSDADVNRLAGKVAEIVYDKTKKLVSDLLDAAEDAAEIAAASIGETAEEVTEAPTEEAPAAEEDVSPEDVRPKRAHVLFRKPMKKDE